MKPICKYRGHCQFMPSIVEIFLKLSVVCPRCINFLDKDLWVAPICSNKGQAISAISSCLSAFCITDHSHHNESNFLRQVCACAEHDGL